MTNNNNNKNEEYYPNSDFEQDVFTDELNDVNQRHLADKNGDIHQRSEQQLLDFDRYILPESERSPCFNELLADIGDEKNDLAWQADDECKHKGLVGLAFSGGGIRSSTLNLGVLQGLKKIGLLQCVDYLSTVSGGGYIGTCLNSLNASIGKKSHDNPQEEWSDFNEVFPNHQGKPDSAVFRPFRTPASYMAPNGLIDYLRVPCIFLRGMVINFFVVLPYILMLSVLSAFLISAEFSPIQNMANMLSTAGINLGNHFIVSKFLLIIFLFTLFLSPLFNLLKIKKARKNTGNTNWNIRDSSTRILGLLAFSIFIREFIELQPFVIALSEQYTMLGYSTGEMAMIAGTGGTGLALFTSKLLPKISSAFSRLGVYGIGFIGVLVFWLFYLHFTNLLLQSGNTAGFSWASYSGLIIISSSLWLFSLLTGDANFTSISRFYRDRLSKAYMLGLTQNDEVEQTDSLKLSELNTSHAPYQLLNATLNLSSTKEAYLKARKGDFFVFSKRYIGSKTTGYCRTKDMEANNHQMNVATAMAISGGAAAPNAGKTTVKALVFILAMLNVRYDYWLLNPKRLKKTSVKKMLTSVTNRPGPWYFLRELFSNLSAKSNYVNLSDGGHLENLGIYELIRRECRLIISGDSEADASLTFSGLADVIRMVQIDFGVKIVMQGLDDIRAGKQHHAIGTIYYKNGKT